jgi:mRNA-degrading endonuclease toxin of MazEF toxin-antitoxin module
VVVVSHDGFNETPGWRSIIVVPLSTSARQAGRGPTAIPIRRGEGALARESVALCHQVTTLDRTKLTRLVGTMPAEAVARLDAGLKAALALL